MKRALLLLACLAGCENFENLRDCARLVDGGRVDAVACGVGDSGTDAGEDAGVDAGVDAGFYVLEAFLKAAVPVQNARFGKSLSISASGNVVVVGAHGADQVTVFIFDGGWHLRETVSGDAGSGFGRAVSVAPDDATIVVGTPVANEAGVLGGASIAATTDEGLGSSVAAQSPALWVAGAPSEVSSACACSSGGVRFADGGALASPAGFAVNGGSFGSALALSANGARLIVGAPYEDGGLERTGAIYVYEDTSSGWSPIARLTNPGLRDQAVLGNQVASNEDGTVVVGGAFNDYGPIGTQQYSGSASVFAQGADGGWGLRRTLREPVPRAGSLYGGGVAISGDATTIAVGGGFAGPAQGGAVDIYDESFQVVQHLDALAGITFGATLAMSADARLLVVGASGDQTACAGVRSIPCGGDAGPSVGAVYLFRRR